MSLETAENYCQSLSRSLFTTSKLPCEINFCCAVSTGVSIKPFLSAQGAVKVSPPAVFNEFIPPETPVTGKEVYLLLCYIIILLFCSNSI